MEIDSLAVANASEVADLIETLLTIAAIVLGGLWAWFKYLRGRTFKRKLNPLVTIAVSRDTGPALLSIDIEVKNVGLTDIAVKAEGTALRLCSNHNLQAHESTTAQELEWEWIATIPVFENHGSIEPGETLREQHVLLLSEGSYQVIRSELFIVSDKLMWSAIGVTIATETSPG